MFDLGLCSYCTLPTGSEDQKECWHSQRENKYLKIGFGLLNLLRQHKQNLSLVCILGVLIVAFTIVASVIWEPFIGHILKLKQKTNQKWDSYTPIVAYIPFFLLCFAYIFSFFFFFWIFPQQMECLLPTHYFNLTSHTLISWEVLIYNWISAFLV